MEKLKNAFGSWIEESSKSTTYWKAAIKLRLANKIGEKMAEHGMNRAGLASEVGHSRSYITQVLGGSKNLTIDSMVTFADAFGLVPRIEFVHPEEFWCEACYFNAEFTGIELPGDLTFDFADFGPSWVFAGETEGQSDDPQEIGSDWEWEKAA
jgi:antitoxin component HigA of HigAB toxin-antitoxin module